MPGAPFEYLLIDISNSFTKLALATSERLGPHRRIPTAALSSESLRKLTAGWKFRRVIVSSVVPAKGAIVRELAGSAALWVSARIELGIGVEWRSMRRSHRRPPVPAGHRAGRY